MDCSFAVPSFACVMNKCLSSFFASISKTMLSQSRRRIIVSSQQLGRQHASYTVQHFPRSIGSFVMLSSHHPQILAARSLSNILAWHSTYKSAFIGWISAMSSPSRYATLTWANNMLQKTVNNNIFAVPAKSETSSVVEDAKEISNALLLSSTVKKRHMKMNKHKLKKRRKALRMNTKASRA